MKTDYKSFITQLLFNDLFWLFAIPYG